MGSNENVNFPSKLYWVDKESNIISIKLAMSLHWYSGIRSSQKYVGPFVKIQFGTLDLELRPIAS